MCFAAVATCPVTGGLSQHSLTPEMIDTLITLWINVNLQVVFSQNAIFNRLENVFGHYFEMLTPKNVFCVWQYYITHVTSRIYNVLTLFSAAYHQLLPLKAREVRVARLSVCVCARALPRARAARGSVYKQVSCCDGGEQRLPPSGRWEDIGWWVKLVEKEKQ